MRVQLVNPPLPMALRIVKNFRRLRQCPGRVVYARYSVSMPPRLFSPGEPVLMRHRRDAYRWAAPMRVVEDRGDFVALYTRPGDTYVHMGDANGRPTRDFFASARVVPSTWGCKAKSAFW